MNPGYLSLLLLCITSVLLFFGWKNQIVQEVSRKSILFYLLLWTFFVFINIPLTYCYTLNLSYLFMIVTSVYIYVKNSSQFVTLNFFVYFFFFSTLYVLLQMLYFMDPMFIIYHPTVDIAVVLAVLIVGVVKNSLEQFTVITFGIIFGDLIVSYIIFHKFPLQLGTLELYDIWLLTFITCRFISETFNRGYQGLKKYFVRNKN